MARGEGRGEIGDRREKRGYRREKRETIWTKKTRDNSEVGCYLSVLSLRHCVSAVSVVSASP